MSDQIKSEIPVTEQLLDMMTKVYHKVVSMAYQRLTPTSEHEWWEGKGGKKFYKYDITFEDGFTGVYNSELSHVNPPAFPVGQEVCFKITSMTSRGNTIMPCKDPEEKRNSAPDASTPGAPPPQNPAKETTYHPEPSNATGSIQTSIGYLSLKLAVEATAGRNFEPGNITTVATTFKEWLIKNLK